MKTENLLKISLIISVSGILLLLLLANMLEPKLININEIDFNKVNQKVKIQGTIFDIGDRGTFKALSVKDETTWIDVLCECEDIKNNQEVIIIGQVQGDKKYLHIQANKIISVS